MIDSDPLPEDAWAKILLGKNLGPYELTSHISDGGFGHVFEARQINTGAIFAIKVLKLGAMPEASVEFLNEGELLRRLSGCDGVISLVDEGVGHVEIMVAGGLSMPVPVRYIVLARASGSVDELTNDPKVRHNLSVIEKLRLWRDVIKAVRQMHDAGVAHRDLKCSNCLLLVRGNCSSVKLADFGRSKDLSVAVTKEPWAYVAGRGDLGYAPPEYLHLQGDPSADSAIAADYYGLGSIFVELITGQSMTSLALGDPQQILKQAEIDFGLGLGRDLGVLTGRYSTIIVDIVGQLPMAIRQSVSQVLNQICHPIPTQRTLPSPYRKDRLDRDGLHWVLKRIDIMIKQLEIEERGSKLLVQKERRSA